jgi:AbrB family looped-hinge helix DNA binding protein
MATATLTADGYLAIPEAIRRSLGLAAGDRLRVEVGPERTLIVRPERVEEEQEEPSPLFGMLEHLAKDRPVSIAEINQAIAEGAAERFLSATIAEDAAERFLYATRR